jgi:hypothetical protein
MWKLYKYATYFFVPDVPTFDSTFNTSYRNLSEHCIVYNLYTNHYTILTVYIVYS